MTIIEALRTENIRLSNGNRHLVFDNGKWIVFETYRYMEITKTLIETDDEEEAVRVLLDE